VFKFLSGRNSNPAYSTRIRVAPLRHLYAGHVLHANVGDFLRRDTDRVAEARGAQMGQEEQVEQLEIRVWQRSNDQVALALRQTYLQVHEQAVRRLGIYFLFSTFFFLCIAFSFYETRFYNFLFIFNVSFCFATAFFALHVCSFYNDKKGAHRSYGRKRKIRSVLIFFIPLFCSIVLKHINLTRYILNFLEFLVIIYLTL
jgi:hypothetical protein